MEAGRSRIDNDIVDDIGVSNNITEDQWSMKSCIWNNGNWYNKLYFQWESNKKTSFQNNLVILNWDGNMTVDFEERKHTYTKMMSCG